MLASRWSSSSSMAAREAAGTSLHLKGHLLIWAKLETVRQGDPTRNETRVNYSYKSLHVCMFNDLIEACYN